MGLFSKNKDEKEDRLIYSTGNTFWPQKRAEYPPMKLRDDKSRPVAAPAKKTAENTETKPASKEKKQE